MVIFNDGLQLAMVLTTNLTPSNLPLKLFKCKIVNIDDISLISLDSLCLLLGTDCKKTK